MAASIYGKSVDQVTDAERFFGKTVILGCGYGMGPAKFEQQLLGMGVTVTSEECQRVIDVYRDTYDAIPALWATAGRCIQALSYGKTYQFDVHGLISTDPRQEGFLLPSGLWQRYKGLARVLPYTDGFTYETRKGRIKVYGGKLVENLCQAVARCVIVEQMVKVAKRYKVVLTVHDSIVCLAPVAEAKEAALYVMECMRWRPDWAKTLPLNCEVKVGTAYGLADIGKFK
jgi:DNA polymerase